MFIGIGGVSLIIVLAIIGALGSSDSAAGPDAESKFISAVKAGQRAPANNDVQVVAAKKARASQVCALLPKSLAVKDWTGQVESIDTEIGGDRGTLSVVITKDVALATGQGFLDTDTMVDPSDDLFDELAELREGQQVTFSGHFAGDSEMCVKETSLMSENGLRTPDFLFTFTNVS